MNTQTQPTTPPVDKPGKYLDLSQFTVPVLDFAIGKFGGIALMDHNERPGPIVAKLPPGRQIGKEHIDHILAIWRQRHDLAPLNVFDTAHELEVVEGTLHRQEGPKEIKNPEWSLSTKAEAYRCAGKALRRFARELQDMKPEPEHSGLTTTQTQPITTGEQAAVNTIIADHTGIEQAIHILPDQHLHDDLGADSLDTIEILLNLEKHLDIEFPEQQFDTPQTVQDIYNAVGEAINIQGPDAEDGEWAFGWAWRFGKGPACPYCYAHGHNGEYIECDECHGSGVVGYKRKPLNA